MSGAIRVMSSVKPRRKTASATPWRAVADHADLLVGHLIAVADRAVADQAAGERLVVKLLVHRRPAVGDSGGEQHLARDHRAFAPFGLEALLDDVEPGDPAGDDRGAVFLRLLLHPLDQLLAGNAVGIAGMVVGAGDPARPALAGVDQLGGEVEAGEVDGGGQPGGAAADDQAVEGGFGHGGRSARRRARFRLTDPR